MTRTSAIPQRVDIELPQWFWGGDPVGFFQGAKLHVRAHQASTNTWTVSTEEVYLQRRPDLVTISHLAGPERSSANYSSLIQTLNSGPSDPSDLATRTRLALSQAQERAQSGDFIEYCYHRQLRATTAGTDELPSLLQQIHAELSARTEAATGHPAFPAAGVHFIRPDRALALRTQLLSVLLRVAHDEDLASGTIANLAERSAAGEHVFASSFDLLNGHLLLDAYLSPLLAAQTPGVWAITAVRQVGTVVISLGRTVAGTRPGAAEALHLLPILGSTESTWSSAPLSPKSSSDTLAWWVGRLNALFGVLSNPAVFSDAHGAYIPAKHQVAMLNIEQAFRRTASALTCHRDRHARRALLFTTIDTLEALTGHNWPDLCRLSFAEKIFTRIEAGLPSTVAEILLPAARRGLAALKQVQDGFFIERGTSPHSPNATSQRDLEQHAADYLYLLRNATHGHGGKTNARDRTLTLLAHHTGELSHDLPLLSYLYLLDILMHPENLSRVLFRGGN